MEFRIRDIEAHSNWEILLVAKGMRQTLVEVLGEEKGSALYSMDWLEERVRWHLDPEKTDGRVFLLEGADGTIVGHAIARIDFDQSFGYFSTVYIDPSQRRKGLAKMLLGHVESWFISRAMPKIIYNTAANHLAI